MVFTTLPGVNSSKISQFGIYSYTFNSPGSYFYYSSLDTDHVMNGTINVTGGGAGAGMVSMMPDFSYFKGGTPAVVTSSSATANTPETKPTGASAAASAVVAGVLALAGLLTFGLTSSTLSGLGTKVSVAVLVSLVGLALSSTMSAGGKRRMTPLGFAIISRVRASDSQ